MKWLPTLRNSKAFTLIEVLIAVALVSIIMLLIYQTTSQSIKAKKKVEVRDEVYHTARVTINKMTQDISMAFLLTGKAHLGQKQGSELMKTEFNGSSDKLHFASLAHLRLFQNSRESEMAEIGYKLEQDPDDSDNLRLMRRETGNIDTNPEEGGIWIPLSEKVKKLAFEYYDGKRHEWISSWNSTSDKKDRLPRAVRVTLTLRHPSKEEEEMPFRTIVLMEMHRNAIDF